MNTWKDKKNLLLVLLTVVCVAVIGCNSMLDGITPGMRHPLSAHYQGDPNSAGLTSLGKLKEDRTTIIVKHRSEQIELKRSAKDDKLAYQDAIGFIDRNIEESQIMQDLIVGAPDQPFSLLGVLAGFTGGAAIGRALKRKGDKDEDEVKAEVSNALVNRA